MMHNPLQMHARKKGDNITAQILALRALALRATQKLSTKCWSLYFESPIKCVSLQPDAVVFLNHWHYSSVTVGNMLQDFFFHRKDGTAAVLPANSSVKSPLYRQDTYELNSVLFHLKKCQ